MQGLFNVLPVFASLTANLLLNSFWSFEQVVVFWLLINFSNFDHFHQFLKTFSFLIKRFDQLYNFWSLSIFDHLFKVWTSYIFDQVLKFWSTFKNKNVFKLWTFLNSLKVFKTKNSFVFKNFSKIQKGKENLNLSTFAKLLKLPRTSLNTFRILKRF